MKNTKNSDHHRTAQLSCYELSFYLILVLQQEIKATIVDRVLLLANEGIHMISTI